MRSPIITVMSNAAIKAGKILLRDFGEVDNLQVSRKGTHGFVTKTDLKIEKLLQKELKLARPEFGFLMEEGGEIAGADATHRWIIDPVDGTNNLIHALPYFCISIGLEHEFKPGCRDIIAGVIYDPIHNDLFYAEQYKGAFLNDRRLAVSSRNEMDMAMLVTGKPHQAAAIPPGVITRCTGASALDLAYVAAGRYDACWYSGLMPWDAAAGVLLVKEAGGVITDIEGQETTIYGRTLLAATPSLHAKVVKLLAGSIAQS